MTNQTPKVSVLMAVYNGEKYLKESIESILNQTFNDLELIIVDDCSTDETTNILHQYAAQDQRLKFIRNEINIGPYASANQGLKLARGEYIARQDSDDISLLNRLEKQVHFLDNHPDVVLVSSLIELTDAAGNPIKVIPDVFEPDLIDWYLLFEHYPGGHSQFMFRRVPFMEMGGYTETYRYGQDYVLCCRLAEVGKLAILPEVLLKLRLHDESISAVKRAEQAVYSLTQSQTNIKALTGEAISLEDMKDLRGFFVIPFNWYYLPDLYLPVERVVSIHRRVREIYHAFIDRLAKQNASDPSLTNTIQRKVRRSVARQFVCWLKHITIKQGFFLKVVLSLYALMWSPSEYIAYWRQKFRRC